MKKFIMSIDAESNGLWGNPFAVAGIIYDTQTGEEIDKICLRLPNEVVTDSWVKENVLPTLNFPVTHTGNALFDTQIGKEKRLKKAYKEMLQDFANWYKKYKDESDVLWHMGHIVESYLFREIHKFGFIGDWDAPYVPIELSTYLEIAGESADSVDSYAKKYNLDITDYGTTHNPLYDCEVAFKCYFHITNKKEGKYMKLLNIFIKNKQTIEKHYNTESDYYLEIQEKEEEEIQERLKKEREIEEHKECRKKQDEEDRRNSDPKNWCPKGGVHNFQYGGGNPYGGGWAVCIKCGKKSK